MCDALVPLGWKVAVEAEPSRFIDFGNLVLDKVLDANAAPGDDWNAAVVFLGSNYGGDEARYEAELRRILDRLAPRPTLLFTVTEYRPNYSEVNEVVRRAGRGVRQRHDRRLGSDLGDARRAERRPAPPDRNRAGGARPGGGRCAGPGLDRRGRMLEVVFRNDSAADRTSGGGSSLGGSTALHHDRRPRPRPPDHHAGRSGPVAAPPRPRPSGGGTGAATTTRRPCRPTTADDRRCRRPPPLTTPPRRPPPRSRRTPAAPLAQPLEG